MICRKLHSKWLAFFESLDFSHLKNSLSKMIPTLHEEKESNSRIKTVLAGHIQSSSFLPHSGEWRVGMNPQVETEWPYDLGFGG